MSAEMIKNSSPCDLGNSDAYNQFQMQRTIESRYGVNEEASGTTASKPLRVLIVDDHRDGSKIMAMLVGIWGHDCRMAYDGTTGLALATEYRPDVIMLDIVMPNMSGIELAKRLRQQPRFQDTLIIAITGCTDAGPRRECEEAGIDLYLIKPVSPIILKTLFNSESTYLTRLRQKRALRTTTATWLPQSRKTKSRISARYPNQVSHIVLAT